MKRRDFLIRATAVAGAGVAVVGGISGLVYADRAKPDPLFNQSFPDLSGKSVAMRQWLGKPVVVNFWATWCPPCVREMPDLEVLHQQYQSVQFVGLGVDMASNVHEFVQKVHVSYPLLVIGNGGVALMRPLGNSAGGLPFTVVFDAQGHIVHRVLGQVKPPVLAQTLGKLSS